MDIMELGAIGELVGGVAVIGSLIFVGLQIRHNSVLIEQGANVAGATMLQATNDSYTEFFRMIAENTELAVIYCKGRKGEELDVPEIARYEALLQVHFAWMEVNYNHQKRGLRPELDESDDSYLDQSAPFTRQLLTAGYAKEWWERDAPYQYGPSFYCDATRAFLSGEGA